MDGGAVLASSFAAARSARTAEVLVMNHLLEAHRRRGRLPCLLPRAPASCI